MKKAGQHARKKHQLMPTARAMNLEEYINKRARFMSKEVWY